MNTKTEKAGFFNRVEFMPLLQSLYRLCKRPFRQKSTRFRITLGLSGLIVSLMLFASILGLVPDKNSAIRDGRAQLAEAIAVNSSIFITVSDIRRMKANLQIIVDRNDDILSAAVRRDDGAVLANVGDHSIHWKQQQGDTLSDNNVSVPIYEGSNTWGQVEITYKLLTPDAWYGYMFQPVFMLLMFISIASFCLIYLYMGKMLKQLDPSQAIPDRVRSALDTMAEGLLVIDSGQNIVLANLAFSTLADRTAEDLMGKSITCFTWLDKKNEPIDAKDLPWAAALSDGIARTANLLRFKIGGRDQQTFMTNCSPVLSGKGKAVGVLVSFDDVTELEQKEIELRISKDEAEQANRFKSEFLANMSHEIRTPMNAILGFSEILKRGYDKNNQDTMRYLNTISSSGNHLLHLINDILDLSKVESGQIEVEIRPTKAHIITQEVVQIMNVKAEEKGIYLRYEPSGSLPEHIETDTGKLRQIITNLVGNAIKFTEEGGVTISTHITDINHKKQLVVDVIDTGIGMSNTQANDVFNPFTQADNSITRRFGGTGLGLTISKRFSEALGGDIVIESEQGAGSVFRVTVDAGDVSASKLLSVEEILRNDTLTFEETGICHTFPNTTILVVDDGEENRALMKVILEELDVTVTTAENGQIAVDLMNTNTYDLVFMDVHMPVMDGLTAVGIIRENGYQLPVVAMTADAMKGAQHTCFDAGYSDYMSKPIDIDKLTGLLKTLLKSAAVEERSSSASGVEKTRVETITAEENQQKIVSSLPSSNEKLRVIIEKFVIRLEQQITALDNACQQRDYAELKRLGHWLKGSSGSIGFNDFIEPAKNVEQAALSQNIEDIENAMIVIHALFRRIDPGSNDERNNVQPLTVASKSESFDLSTIPENIVCRLNDKSPRIRPIVEKFTKDLSAWCKVLKTAVDIDDYQRIESFAYWLKASAGSVGFDVFTTPARDLESHAKSCQKVPVQQGIKMIVEMQCRIVLSQKDSASCNDGNINRA